MKFARNVGFNYSIMAGSGGIWPGNVVFDVKIVSFYFGLKRGKPVENSALLFRINRKCFVRKCPVVLYTGYQPSQLSQISERYFTDKKVK